MQKDHSITGAVLVLAVALALVAGCQQPQQAPANERQARLLATQNADLQKQVAAARDEIETLRRKHTQELRQRDEELAKCKARIEVLQQDVEKGVAERVTGVTATLMDENAKLRQEVDQLKTQLANAPQQPVP